MLLYYNIALKALVDLSKSKIIVEWQGASPFQSDNNDHNNLVEKEGEENAYFDIINNIPEVFYNNHFIYLYRKNLNRCLVNTPHFLKQRK